MRLTTIALLMGAIAAYGCDKSANGNLTADQQKQLEVARQATVDSSEKLLGRQLSDAEKNCIYVRFDDGQLKGDVAPPLSDELKQRQAAISASQPSQSAANTEAGMSKYQYVAADGGPHLLLPAEAAGFWKGASSVASVLDPNSDYGRACAATAKSRMAAISVGASSALVFDNPPMTAWGKSADGLIEIYYLESWTSTNLDALIDKASEMVTTDKMNDTNVTFQLTEPNAFLLYAGDTPTSNAYGVARIPVPTGKYRILFGRYSAQAGAVTIYRLKPA